MAGRRPSSLNASGLVVVAVRPEATIGTTPLRPFAVHQICPTYGVARSASDTPGATLGTDHHIGGTLPTTGDANRVLGALWRSEARIHHRALDHFFAEEFGGGRRTVELERAAPLRYMHGIGLHAVNDLLLRGATGGDERGADQHNSGLVRHSCISFLVNDHVVLTHSPRIGESGRHLRNAPPGSMRRMSGR
jgi:hypothetical protein